LVEALEGREEGGGARSADGWKILDNKENNYRVTIKKMHLYSGYVR
jgi:hypothetical protein